MAKYTIGVDVGGTNIKFGLMNLKGRIIFRETIETKTIIQKDKLIKGIINSILYIIEQNNLSKKDIMGIGCGLPGLVNSEAGIVNFLPNIPGWRNVHLKKIFEKKLGIPTFVENDVNLITLGEWKYGAGRGYKNLICVTMGTGVGGGLILNNSLYRGEGYVAGEIGHVPLNEKGPDCNCGGFGCVERYVGNTYLLEKVRKLFKNKNLQLEDIFDLANKDNSRAIEFWEETAAHIANVLVGAVNLLNPRLIIIGGGVANSFKFMQKTIEDIIIRRSMKVQGKMVKIVKAKLGPDAGIIGAQALILSSL